MITTFKELLDLVAEIDPLLPGFTNSQIARMGASYQSLRGFSVHPRALPDGRFVIHVHTVRASFTVEPEEGDTAQGLANVIMITANDLQYLSKVNETPESRIEKLEKEVSELKSSTRLYR